MIVLLVKRVKLLYFLKILASVLFVLNVTSCAKDTNLFSNNLLGGSSSNANSLWFYHYNGENIYQYFVQDDILVQEILDKLDSIPIIIAESWSLDNIALPIYGLGVVGEDGWMVYSAWSNGYWITQDGFVYEFEFDFKTLEKQNWMDEIILTSFSMFPNARLLTEENGRWNTMLLTPSNILEPPEYILVNFISLENEIISITIRNDRDYDWVYNVGFTLQVLLDDVWYNVPCPPSVFFSDIFIIPAREERVRTYWIDLYGNLPSGVYRLVTYDQLSVEFYLE